MLRRAEKKASGINLHTPSAVYDYWKRGKETKLSKPSEVFNSS